MNLADLGIDLLNAIAQRVPRDSSAENNDKNTYHGSAPLYRIHLSFARNPNTGQVLSFRETARGSFRGKLTPILAEEIEHDAEVIYNAGMDLQGFMMARGLGSISRIKSLRAPIKRSKEARAKRSPPNRIAG